MTRLSANRSTITRPRDTRAQKIDLIGEKKARKIREIIDSEYVADEE